MTIEPISLGNLISWQGIEVTYYFILIYGTLRSLWIDKVTGHWLKMIERGEMQRIWTAEILAGRMPGPPPGYWLMFFACWNWSRDLRKWQR